MRKPFNRSQFTSTITELQKKKRAELELSSLRKIQDNIEQPSDWGNGFGTTKRKNGETVEGGFRNITDLGNLGKSTSVVWRGNKLYAVVAASYAEYVLFGYMTSSGNIVPGRDYLDLSR